MPFFSPNSKRTTFNPDTEIPDLSGKVFLVTGGTAGIGRSTLLHLARRNPAALYFTGRNAAAAASAIEEIKATASSSSTAVKFIECDFTDLDSVETAANSFLTASSQQRLDALNCNAGVMNVPPALTRQGYEVEFGVNFLAHALLIKLLLPLLLDTAARFGVETRIVSDTSLAHKLTSPDGISFDLLKTDRADTYEVGGGKEGSSGRTASGARYPQSKLATVLYATQLARRYPGVTSVSVHPGIAHTDLVRRLPEEQRSVVHRLNPDMMSPDEGAHNQTWAMSAAPRGSLQNGGYYEPVGQLGERVPLAADDELGARLWTWTQEQLRGYLESQA